MALDSAIDADAAARIVAWFDAGVPLREIGRRLGVHGSTILRAVRRYRASGDPLDLCLSPRRRRAQSTRRARIAAAIEKDRAGRAEDLDRLDLISRRLAEGVSLTEASGDAGTTRTSAYRLARRVGVDLPRGRRFGTNSIREQIADMKRSDAIEHLLYLVEEMTGAPDDLADAAATYGFTPLEAKVYLVLARRAGRIVTVDMISAAISDPDEPASRHLIATLISHIRRKLDVAGPGESIENQHGLGYRLCITHDPDLRGARVREWFWSHFYG